MFHLYLKSIKMNHSILAHCFSHLLAACEITLYEAGLNSSSERHMIRLYTWSLLFLNVATKEWTTAVFFSQLLFFEGFFIYNKVAHLCISQRLLESLMFEDPVDARLP